MVAVFLATKVDAGDPEPEMPTDRKITQEEYSELTPDQQERLTYQKDGVYFLKKDIYNQSPYNPGSDENKGILFRIFNQKNIAENVRKMTRSL